MMKGSSWNSLDTVVRNATPFFMALALVVIGQLPFSLPGHASVTPFFVLMAVYYWELHRPDLLPVLAVFPIGLLQDVLEGEPLGVNAFVLVAVSWIVISQQRFFKGKPFLVVWWGFAMVALVAAILRWMLVSLLFGVAISLWAIAFELVLTVTLYPVLTVAFTLAHRTLPRGDYSDFGD